MTYKYLIRRLADSLYLRFNAAGGLDFTAAAQASEFPTHAIARGVERLVWNTTGHRLEIEDLSK